MKKSILILGLVVIAVAIMGSGCKSLSPSQGAGVLYIYEYGESRSVRVKSITFWSTRTVSYTDEDGVRHVLTDVPVHYVPSYQGGE